MALRLPQWAALASGPATSLQGAVAHFIAFAIWVCVSAKLYPETRASKKSGGRLRPPDWISWTPCSGL